MATKAIVLALVLASGGSAVHALPPLSEHERINGALLAGVIGDKIRRECASISPRIFRVMQEIHALKAYAREQGYSEAEIEAFIDSDADEARLKEMASRYLAARGAVEGREETYCAIGRREIARQSPTGRLLRAH